MRYDIPDLMDHAPYIVSHMLRIKILKDINGKVCLDILSVLILLKHKCLYALYNCGLCKTDVPRISRLHHWKMCLHDCASVAFSKEC